MTTTTHDPRPEAGLYKPSSSELSHASIGQWGAVIAGVLAGFAATVLMATLGTALGLSATAAVVDHAADGREAAAGLGIGAALWLLISAVVVGIVGGITLARASRLDRPYHAPLLGLVTWAGGMVLAVVLGAAPMTGLASGAGGGTVAAATRSNRLPADARAPLGTEGERTRTADGRPSDDPALTAQERTRIRAAAEDAAKAAATLAWALLIAQVLSLIATTVSARAARKRVLTQAGAVLT